MTILLNHFKVATVSLVTGEVIRSGTHNIVTNLQAFDEDTEELLADGRAVFSVKRAE